MEALTLKEFIVWLEEYLAEGHDVINAKCVLHELKNIAGDANEGSQKGKDEEQMIPSFESEIKRTRICLKAAIGELDRILNTKSLPADDRIYLSEIRWSTMTALGWIDDADKKYAKYYKEDKR